MIELVKVKDKTDGQVKAHEILKKIIDPTTLLALSGGTSVDYRKMIVKPDDFAPGAICVVDERFGEPFHNDSNEKLLADAGIKEYADKECIETIKYLIGKNFAETASVYEKRLVELFDKFPKRVGVMGVGSNLHTAGIFPNSKAVKSDRLVEAVEVVDAFSRRMTLTVKALEQFTNFVILMFGQEKREALEIMLDEAESNLAKYPAVFYRKSKIKSFLVTDIQI